MSDDIKRQVEERVKAESREVKTDTSGGGLASKFIDECLKAKDLGNGMLYAEIHKNQFILNKSINEVYKWSDHHWVLDELNEHVGAVENVTDIYLKAARDLTGPKEAATKDNNKETLKSLLKKEKFLYARAGALREFKGRNNTVKFAFTNRDNALCVNNEQFDNKPTLLACKNGVVDLETGNFRDGRPEDYLLNASPIKWTGIDTPAPAWEKFLLEIFEGDVEMVEYMGRLFGYACTGLTKEKLLPIFWGPHGNNGKSTIVEIIKFVMGPLAIPIPSEIFLSQRFTSTGPTPDILSLKGLRIAFGSETDENRRFSPSKVKWLSGKDTLTGRNPYDKRPTTFYPSHTLFLMTNERPGTPVDDKAFWTRVRLIKFNLSFVDYKPKEDFERPADLDLFEKLQVEASGILAWLVRGCLIWQRDGMKVPWKVTEETGRYQREEDDLTDFIEDICVVDKSLEVGATALYTAFREWWIENIDETEKRVPTQKRFGKMMRKRFKKEKRGTYRYIGLDISFGS